MKKKTKVLLSSLLAIGMSASLATGATYALFTSESTVNVAVTSGTVSVKATAENLVLASTLGTTLEETSATIKDGNQVELVNLVPGDYVTFDLRIKNDSNVAIQTRTVISLIKDSGLFDGLVVTINGAQYGGMTTRFGWLEVAPNSADVIVPVKIELPEDKGNEYQATSCTLAYTVEAVQGNGVYDLPSGITLESFGTNHAVDSEGNYYASLKDALIGKAASSVSTMSASYAEEEEESARVIYLKPNTDLGTITHADVVGDVTIYGNYSYISGGERDLAVDTYVKYENGDTVDITIYDLDGLAVWGQRNSTATINLTIENCQNMNRVYISGTSGAVNLDMKNCSFEGKIGHPDTAVYTNAEGTLNITGTTFSNIAVALNQNNKTTGVQNINLTDCTFINCAANYGVAESNKHYAAPVRAVTSQGGTTNVVLNGVKFEYSAGLSAVNGNVLVYNTTGADNGTVNVTIDGEVLEKVPTVVRTQALFETVLNDGGYAMLSAGEYKMPSVGGNKEFTIVGTKDTVIDNTMGSYMDSSKVSFEGVTIKGSTGMANGNGSDYAALYCPDVTYTNCTFDGPFRIGRDGAKFINCTFTNLGNDYVWTYGNDVEFIGCTFETAGKAILIYSDGGNEVSKVTVKNCTFKATQGAKAGAIANQNCAAIEIHNYGNGVNLTTSGNTFDSNFSGEWRIKTYETGKPKVIVNGVEYTTIAIDGKTMTINANKEVTVQE